MHKEGSIMTDKRNSVMDSGTAWSVDGVEYDKSYFSYESILEMLGNPNTPHNCNGDCFNCPCQYMGWGCSIYETR